MTRSMLGQEGGILLLEGGQAGVLGTLILVKDISSVTAAV